MTYQYEDCTFEKNEGIGIFTMKRPNRRNAWSIKMGEGFDHALEEMTSDPTSKVFIITGADEGQAFTSGLDLKDFGPKEGEEEPNLYQRWQRALQYQDGYLRIREFKLPTIAAVNGIAVGMGMDLALTCDIIIASEKAQFGQFYVKRGMIPDMGGTWYLPRLIGWYRASELIFTADLIDAQEADRIGLVNRVVAQDELIPHVMGIAQRIAANPPLTVQLAKRVMWRGMERNLRDTIYDLVMPFATINSDTEDIKEAFQAFREKRPPVFKGK